MRPRSGTSSSVVFRPCTNRASVAAASRALPDARRGPTRPTRNGDVGPGRVHETRRRFLALKSVSYVDPSSEKVTLSPLPSGFPCRRWRLQIA